MTKKEYCCCTGTVHCRYCVRAGKPPHLTVDAHFNTVLIEPIYELNNMNNTTLLDSQAAIINAIKLPPAYIVGSVDSRGHMSFASNPKVHSSSGAARGECNRLARMNPGKLYVFVMLSGAEMIPAAIISI